MKPITNNMQTGIVTAYRVNDLLKQNKKVPSQKLQINYWDPHVLNIFMDVGANVLQ